MSAATWTAIVNIGVDGYSKIFKEILDTAAAVEEGVRGISDIEIAGTRHLSVVAFRSTKLNVHNIGDAMKARGWNLNSLQDPPAIHLCITNCNVKSAAKCFVSDLKESVEEVKTSPEKFKNGSAAIYGLAESLPDKSIVSDVCKTYIDALFQAQ